MNDRVKVRKKWIRNPVERVKESDKEYDRNKERKEIRELLEDELGEDDPNGYV